MTWYGREGLLKRIHVNQHVIRANRKLNVADPPIRIKTYRENVSASSVRIEGPSELIYSPEDPLSCGARLWIETRSAVRAD